jgi:glucose/arabinose dehydrogenase
MIKLFLVLAILLWNRVAAVAAPSVADTGLQVQEIVGGLNTPTTMAFIGTRDILVLEKNTGRVRRVLNGTLQSAPVLDVHVDTASERGMLGIAVHPNFPGDAFVYLYFTESTSNGSDTSGSPAGNRVYRYIWNPVNARLEQPLLLQDLPALPGPNHDGGAITFGPDGKLYIVIGDLNRSGQLQNNGGGAAPDDTSVILRLNDDGSVPDDNPFASQGSALRKYYAYGIRNSFGLAFDPFTDKLWDTENGPDSYDEINLVEPGFNSGWNKIMGPDSRDLQNTGDLVSFADSHYADPKFSWRNPIGVTAITFLDSDTLGAQYLGDVFVGDVNNGRIYRLQPNGARNGFVLGGALGDGVADNTGELNPLIFASGFDGVTDLKVGPDGRLYVVSIGAGKLYAITAGPRFSGNASLPSGEVGAFYNAALPITGGVPPYQVVVAKGELPAGLNVAAGILTGTPIQKGTATFSLEASDQNGFSSTKVFRLRVIQAIAIRTNRLRDGRAGRAYKARLSAKAGQKPFTWSISAGALPAGLALDPATGAISGTPVSAGSSNFTVRVSDNLDGTATQDLSLTIKP